MIENIRVLVYFKKQSRYAPPREGEFVQTPTYGNLHVYKGKTLSVEEFNALPEWLFEAGRVSETVRVRLLDERIATEVKRPVVKKVETLEKMGAPVLSDVEPAAAWMEGLSKSELKKALSLCASKEELLGVAEAAGIRENPSLERKELESRIYKRLCGRKEETEL